MMFSHRQLLLLQTLLRIGKIARDVIEGAVGFAQLVHLVRSAGREADCRHTRKVNAEFSLSNYFGFPSKAKFNVI
jgi:hypothetical protein